MMECRWIIMAVFACVLATGVSSKSCKKTVLQDQEGSFQSPGYPADYPNKVECDYVIKADKNHYIVVTFLVFELEDKLAFSETMPDFLEVFDGRDDNRQQEATYYGKKTEPFEFISQTNRVIMRFVSDKSKTYKGFYATYKVLPVSSQCDELVIRKGIVNCDNQESGAKPASCNVTCEEHYDLLEGDGIVNCHVTDSILPKCVANAAKLDVCSNDINDEDCPFTAEEAKHEMDAVMEELAKIPALVVRGAESNCQRLLCTKNRFTLRYTIVCPLFSDRLKAAYGWGDPMTNLWKTRCWVCQSENCGMKFNYLG